MPSIKHLFSFFTMSSEQHYYKENPFMTCVLDVRSSSRRTVKKVLRKCHGLVHNFRMEGGKVEISGTIDPEKVLKGLRRAGYNAKIIWLQFGECSSSNRYMSGPTTTNYQGRLFLQSANPLPSHYARAAYVHQAGYPRYNNHHYNCDYQQSYDNYHGQYYYNYNNYHQQRYEELVLSCEVRSFVRSHAHLLELLPAESTF